MYSSFLQAEEAAVCSELSCRTKIRQCEVLNATIAEFRAPNLGSADRAVRRLWSRVKSPGQSSRSARGGWAEASKCGCAWLAGTERCVSLISHRRLLLRHSTLRLSREITRLHATLPLALTFGIPTFSVRHPSPSPSRPYLCTSPPNPSLTNQRYELLSETTPLADARTASTQQLHLVDDSKTCICAVSCHRLISNLALDLYNHTAAKLA